VSARVACVVTIFIGALWAVLGLLFAESDPVHDMGLGAVVAAAGWLGLGFLNWERR